MVGSLDIPLFASVAESRLLEGLVLAILLLPLDLVVTARTQAGVLDLRDLLRELAIGVVLESVRVLVLLSTFGWCSLPQTHGEKNVVTNIRLDWKCLRELGGTIANESRKRNHWNWFLQPTQSLGNMVQCSSSAREKI